MLRDDWAVSGDFHFTSVFQMATFPNTAHVKSFFPPQNNATFVHDFPFQSHWIHFSLLYHEYILGYRQKKKTEKGDTNFSASLLGDKNTEKSHLRYLLDYTWHEPFELLLLC